MIKKGFIFDLDGVIVDTAKYHYLAWKRLAESIGITFSQVQNEQLKGVSRVRSLEKILDWGGKTLSQDEFSNLMTQKNDDYLTYIDTMSATEILPDVERVISFLQQHRQPIALGSASKNARLILKKVDLLEHFDTIVDGTNVTKAKPDPEVFLIAAKQIEMPQEQCIVFEDSVAGVQAANAAGMLSIGIGSTEVLGAANHVFKDFTEMSNEFLMHIINHKP